MDAFESDSMTALAPQGYPDHMSRPKPLLTILRTARCAGALVHSIEGSCSAVSEPGVSIDVTPTCILRTRDRVLLTWAFLHRFGFISYKSQEDALHAMQTLHQKELKDHPNFKVTNSADAAQGSGVLWPASTPGSADRQA